MIGREFYLSLFSLFLGLIRLITQFWYAIEIGGLTILGLMP